VVPIDENDSPLPCPLQQHLKVIIEISLNKFNPVAKPAGKILNSKGMFLRTTLDGNYPGILRSCSKVGRTDPQSAAELKYKFGTIPTA